jgi:hypothetical protein
MLALDGALPGASVELLREGAFLHVRMRAANDATLRLLESKRHRLVAALGQSTTLQVSVEVIHEQDQYDSI